MQHYGRVRITAYIVTGLWSLAILAAGVQLSSAWSKILSCVPLLVVAGFAIFDNSLWHVGPIKRVVRRPQLNGTWKGSLISLRPDESGQEVKHAPIPIFISIWQTYLTLAGKIAYRVREKSTTLPADIVPCWEYRRYDRIENGYPVFQEGSCVFPTGGSRTENYPEQQRQQGNEKNSRTAKRYKRMVRTLKKFQTRLEDQGIITDPVPSYAIECLVYNVPDTSFGHSTYKADMRAVLATIFNATLPDGNWNDWEEVNGLKYLFRGNASWSHEQVHRLADAAWDELGLG